MRKGAAAPVRNPNPFRAMQTRRSRIERPRIFTRQGAAAMILLAAVAGGAALAGVLRMNATPHTAALPVSAQIAAPDTGQVPVFTKDIAPIVYANCASCHNPGGMAPMSLLTYRENVESGALIREYVAAEIMPPWHADAPRGVFLNDRRLSEGDKRTFLRWLDEGMPEGDPRDLPPRPELDRGWEIGTPDVVLTMPEAFEVPAQGEIPYQYVRIPTNFTEDKWVQAIEIMPGAREVVHHVLVYARAPGEGGAQGRAGGGRAAGAAASLTPEQRANIASQPPSGYGTLIATTAPGTNAQHFPEGTALRIPAGSVLTFQLHYTAHGMAMKDQSSLGLVFAKGPPEREMHASYFVNPRFVIPPGAADHRVDAQITFPRAATIYGILPHTHLRGKRWEYTLVTPDGTSRTILSVPNYDFNWQTYYLYREPLQVPAGSRLVSSAWYDNSAANRSNPDPTAEVRWGDQTWEEMQYSGLLFTVQDGGT